ncbi:MAG: aspartate--tRNA(Asn) ligase [Candidatus Nomurabacteria bacterium]|jgi:nondiscriminating aspartyl-tRNA synthetase|nr:aspartate--tRNA(Asn) ligase [Candidatus Nomurabacteria bacterium]
MEKERVLSDEVAGFIGQEIQIEGWLHKKRLMGGLNFLSVRDRRGVVQILVEDKDELEKLRGLQIGTVLEVVGKVVADERAPGGAELHDVRLKVVAPVIDEPMIEVDKPINHKAENLETLFETRVLNVRNLQEQKIFKIRAFMTQMLREYLISQEFVEIDTPKILAEATEGGAEVFSVDYFGKKGVLAQSPQFYKQIMVGAFERVFEINHSYRAEPSATTRHVSELLMMDLEMGFVRSHGEVLDMVAGAVKYAVTKTYEKFADELRSLQASELKLTESVPIFTIAEIHEMYFKATKNDVREEKDLIPDEEKFIAEYARKELGSDLVFASEFPAAAAKFYHKVDAEKGVVYWADLIYRGIEIATCPLREHNYEKMIEQMKAAGLDVDHPGYKYYLQAFKYGLPAHGGCGLGVDRLVQKTVGLHNVKEAILFPRDIHRMTP